MRIHHGTPLPHAEELEDVSDFFLIEAGEYWKDKGYQEWARKLRERGFVTVLDQGAGIGEPTPWDRVVEAFHELHPTYLVLPDTLYDKDATLEASAAALADLPDIEATGYTLVIQGNSEDEMLQCLKTVLDDKAYDRVSCIGIPFRMWQGSPDSTRAKFMLENKIQLFVEAPIHLFGCRCIFDYTLNCDLIDSRFAFKHAVAGIDVAASPKLEYFKNPMEMDKRYDQEIVDLARRNAEAINNARTQAEQRGVVDGSC